MASGLHEFPDDFVVEIGWCLREERTLLKKIWGCN
jgi:hypothetical protein